MKKKCKARRSAAESLMKLLLDELETTESNASACVKANYKKRTLAWLNPRYTICNHTHGHISTDRPNNMNTPIKTSKISSTILLFLLLSLVISQSAHKNDYKVIDDE